MNTLTDTPILERLSGVIGTDPLAPMEQMHALNAEARRLRERAGGIRTELAPLRARFYGGTASHYDHERKLLLAELMEAERRRLQEDGERVVETALDRYAHAAPEYKQWLREQHRDRERMSQLEAQIAQIDADLEGITAERSVFMQASRLAEECVRLARAEMGLG